MNRVPNRRFPWWQRLGVLAVAASLAACAAPRNAPPSYPSSYPAGSYGGSAPVYPAPTAGTEYGRVAHIETLYGPQRGQTSGGGAVLGAVVGGVLGNQVGKGSGRAAATAVGVLGGAVAGNAIEGRQSGGETVQGYRLHVQLDQGGVRIYDVPSPGDLRVGDRVRLQGGQIARW